MECISHQHESHLLVLENQGYRKKELNPSQLSLAEKGDDNLPGNFDNTILHHAQPS